MPRSITQFTQTNTSLLRWAYTENNTQIYIYAYTHISAVTSERINFV